MPSPASNASDSGNDVAKAKSAKITSRLSPEQLARKRANDRESQRAIRARNKDLIASLQREVHELRSRDDARAIQELLRRNGALESELRLLRHSLGLQPQPTQHLGPNTHIASLHAFPTPSNCNAGLSPGSKYNITRRVDQPSSVWASGQYGSDQDPSQPLQHHHHQQQQQPQHQNQHQQQQPPQNPPQITQVPLGAPQHETWCSPVSMASTAEIPDVSTTMEGLFPSAPPDSANLSLVPKSHMSVPNGNGSDGRPNPGSPAASMACYGDPRGLHARPNETCNDLQYFTGRDAPHGVVSPASQPALHESGLMYRV
ncbi:hypothetical protein E4U43_005117 [Claviceps pusilla]|uniref:BZIP domain-containing protein n=1 Tax=Claviceps pusilla TaxID=123648 RepID=A0A9P7N3U8_9HYPO|nr:hypothetical protein E4U43_005117 [Claviceps pusilla]